jgi:hypothetical protein
MTDTGGTRQRETGHRHDRHCYWDVWECRWVCGPRPAAEPAPMSELRESAVSTEPTPPLTAR